MIKFAQISGDMPVYEKYQGQSRPQRAFIAFDTRSNVVDAWVNPELGTGVPVDVWNRKILIWEIHPETTGESIRELFENKNFAELMERFAKLKNEEQEDEEEEEDEDELNNLIERFLRKNLATIPVWGFCDWACADLPGIKKDLKEFGIEETIKKCQKMAKNYGVWLDVRQAKNFFRDLMEEEEE